MKNLKSIVKTSVVVLGCLGFTTQAFAQEATNVQGSSGTEFRKVGAAGGQVLKIGVGARANGMAGAFSAVSNDLSSLFYNTAGLVDLKGYQATVGYTQWFGGYSHNFLGACLPAGDKYRVGLSVTSLSSGDIPVTTIDRENDFNTKYSINDFAIGATFSAFLTDQFTFGTTLKYLQNNVASMQATGVTIDVGTMYRFNGFRTAFSINNLGPQMAYSGQDLNTKVTPVDGLNSQPLDASLTSNPYNLPLSFKAGIAADLMSEVFGEYQSRPDLGVGEARDHRWLLAVDFETLSDVSEQFAVGTEYTWMDILSVRGGYRFGQDEFGLSGGVGLSYVGSGFSGAFDYSIQPTKTLGVVNRISVSMKLD